MEELRSASSDSEVLDGDRERKQWGKDYADNMRGVRESNLREGNEVRPSLINEHLKQHPMRWLTSKEVRLK